MRKFLTMIATLLMALGLMAPAYAAETTSADAGEYTEAQQYVAYLVQNTDLYLGPDKSYDKYDTSSGDYNEKIVVTETLDNGWVQIQRDNSSVLLYTSSENLIVEEADVYTQIEYKWDFNKSMINSLYWFGAFFVLILLAWRYLIWPHTKKTNA